MLLQPPRHTIQGPPNDTWAMALMAPWYCTCNVVFLWFVLYLIMLDYVYNPSLEIISCTITILHCPIQVCFCALPYSREYTYTWYSNCSFHIRLSESCWNHVVPSFLAGPWAILLIALATPFVPAFEFQSVRVYDKHGLEETDLPCHVSLEFFRQSSSTTYFFTFTWWSRATSDTLRPDMICNDGYIYSI